MMLVRRMLRCLCHLGVSPFCDRANITIPACAPLAVAAVQNCSASEDPAPRHFPIPHLARVRRVKVCAYPREQNRRGLCKKRQQYENLEELAAYAIHVT